ncbi:MAG: hypothetical protein SFT91_00920 [Rickettsiaceae bacterium]|nr:hypothetical protein [Rickettsiaceae bacterium]
MTKLGFASDFIIKNKLRSLGISPEILKSLKLGRDQIDQLLIGLEKAKLLSSKYKKAVGMLGRAALKILKSKSKKSKSKKCQSIVEEFEDGMFEKLNIISELSEDGSLESLEEMHKLTGEILQDGYKIIDNHGENDRNHTDREEREPGEREVMDSMRTTLIILVVLITVAFLAYFGVAPAVLILAAQILEFGHEIYSFYKETQNTTHKAERVIANHGLKEKDLTEMREMIREVEGLDRSLTSLIISVKSLNEKDFSQRAMEHGDVLYGLSSLNNRKGVAEDMSFAFKDIGHNIAENHPQFRSRFDKASSEHLSRFLDALPKSSRIRDNHDMNEVLQNTVSDLAAFNRVMTNFSAAFKDASFEERDLVRKISSEVNFYMKHRYVKLAERIAGLDSHESRGKYHANKQVSREILVSLKQLSLATGV